MTKGTLGLFALRHLIDHACSAENTAQTTPDDSNFCRKTPCSQMKLHQA